MWSTSQAISVFAIVYRPHNGSKQFSTCTKCNKLFVVLCVCFTKSPRPKPFIYQYVWFTRKWTFVRNTFLWIASQEKTRLHKQRQLRTVMFYSDGQTLLLESSRKLFSDDTRDTLRTKQWNSSDLPASFAFPLTSFSRLLVSSSNVQT